jgi:uncharacterized peroxidase-related enzyme
MGVIAKNLAVVSEADAPLEVAALYAMFREEFDRPQVPGILQCFATHPPLLEHMMGLAKSLLFVDGALGRKTKELVGTFISARNQCDYCADSHGAFLRMNGASADLLDAAMSCDLESLSLDAAHKALLSFVSKVTDAAETIEPTDVEALRAYGWSDLQIAETIHLTALFACFNRVVSAFGLPSQGMLAMIEVQADKTEGRAG